MEDSKKKNTVSPKKKKYINYVDILRSHITEILPNLINLFSLDLVPKFLCLSKILFSLVILLVQIEDKEIE